MSPDFLIRQQDYFWFLAGVVFAVALLQSLRVSGEARSWPWLPWLLAGNGIMVLVELIWLSQPLQINPYGPPPREPLDLGFGAIMAVQVWQLAGRGRRRWVAVAWALGLAALAWLRQDYPWSATVLMALVGTGALLPAARPGEARPGLALSVTVLIALWFSPVGPLTGVLNNLLIDRFSPVWVANSPPGGALNALTVGLRRWSVPSSWGLWVSLAFLLAAGLAFWRLTARLPRERERQEWKRFASLAGVWLVAGLFLTGLMSRWARHTYENSAVAYARLAAALLPPDQLEAAFGARLELQAIQPGRRAGVTFGTVTSEYQAAVRPIRRLLTRIEQNSPSELTAIITVDRAGWRAIAADADARPGDDGKMLLLGRAEAFVGEKREPAYLPPHQTGGLGMMAMARAPLTGVDGTFLAWLVLLSDSESWLAAQTHVRMQAFAIIALGLALAVMGLRGRLNGFERDEARQADKTKTEFLARVSHELRSPIQSVLGYSELLKSAVQSEEARGRLSALRQHGQLMLRLVNDLLNLSALQSGRFPLAPSPTRVDELVRQTVESLRPEAAVKGLALDFAAEGGAFNWHLADGERLRQVVINLVGNAIKFTDRGSVVVRLQRHDDGLDLSVQDTGFGMTAIEIGRLFKPFARLDRTAAKEGTGLGLALSAALCECMGGGITVDSEPGIGTRFVARFRLPACLEPSHTKHQNALSLAGRRVLVVEDNTLIRELFRDYLQELGAHCVAVPDGATALATLSSEPFGAVVVDIALPEMDGVELTRRIRAEVRQPPRIVGVSAHAGEDIRHRALAAGMDGFLSKPVELYELASALQAQRPAQHAPLPQKTGLTERLHAQFRAEAPVLEAALTAALAEADWTVMQAKAHYLKNSADVLQRRELAAACGDLEAAADREDAEAARAALQICQIHLAAWR